MDNEFFNNIDGGLDDIDTKVSDILKAADNLPAIVDENELTAEKKSDDETTKNQNFAIENLKNVSKITEQSVRELFVLAKSTDSPRAWEVLAGMLKTQIDASKTIMDISNKDSNNVGDVTNNITNNNTIINSSEDLFNYLNEDGDDEFDTIEGEILDE